MLNTPFKTSIGLLFTRKFGTFWFASLLSNIGTWSQQVAQPWLMLSLGASSVLLGLDAFAMGAPVFFLTLIGGMLADYADRRRVIVIFQSIQMLCPVLIVILIVTHSIQPWMIIVLSLIVGITDALSMPSFQSIVPSIVQRKQIPAGIALNSTQFNLSRILGPAIAGMLMASAGVAWAFGISAASYIPFILVTLWILPVTSSRMAKSGGFNYKQIVSSVEQVAREPALRGALLSVLITSGLCAPLITFCPLLIKEAFAGNINHFSIAVGAFGVGGLIGALGLLGIDSKYDRRPLSLCFAIGYGVIVVMTSLNIWFWGLPLLFVLGGIMMTASNASANTLLQSQAPANIRGQTVSLFMLAVRGGLSLGSLFTGITISLLGVREALFLNGLLAIILQMALAYAWLKAPLPRKKTDTLLSL